MTDILVFFANRKKDFETLCSTFAAILSAKQNVSLWCELLSQKSGGFFPFHFSATVYGSWIIKLNLDVER